MKRPPALDPTKLKTSPLAERSHLVHVSDFAGPLQAGMTLAEFLAALPRTLAAQDLMEVTSRICSATRGNRMVLVGMGAHVIKVGLSPLIVTLMEEGIVTGVALNGAGIIHDVEIAMVGSTSEDVAQELRDGSFGTASETGSLVNGWTKTGVDAGYGLGEAVGRGLLDEAPPHVDKSVVAAAVRLDIPVTVHVAIGTDTVHIHPEADGAAIGEGSLRDFKLFASLVADLTEGVYMNVGSAVILPEVFLKAITLARNLGRPVRDLTTVNIDFLRHYRPMTNVIDRPTRDGGHGFTLTGHHEILLPLLFAAVLDELSRGDGS